MESRSRARNEPPLIGALLRARWQDVRARILRDLESAGFHDISAAHLAVFQHPTPRGVRLAALAQRAGQSRQAMAYLVGELERRGYLERRPDPEDGRASLIHLTDRGEQAIRAIRGAVKRVERDWQRALGAARFAELRNTLVELSALGEPDRSGGG